MYKLGGVLFSWSVLFNNASIEKFFDMITRDGKVKFYVDEVYYRKNREREREKARTGSDF
jgi:hypothetical protein